MLPIIRQWLRAITGFDKILTMPSPPSHTFCVAPMMDWTDRHDRVFLRLISHRALLYTEMVTSAALIRGGAHYLLEYNLVEHPIALQLGGSDPAELALAAKLGEEAGFDEINLNVGCPSERVRSGAFGACLMADRRLVGECVAAMKNAVSIPVTVKCRIGIDSFDSADFLRAFIETIATNGCERIIIHARIAILQGLSPKENRSIPPLNYQRVYDMKTKYPGLEIVINGGIQSLTQCHHHLSFVDGVMLGREAYQNPYCLSQVDHQFFGDERPIPTRAEVMTKYMNYIEAELSKGTPLQHITRHVLGLFKGEHGGKLFRRHLSENSYRPGASIDVLETALKYVT